MKKVLNSVLMSGLALSLVACGGSTTTITDINEQRVFFAFDRYDIQPAAREGLLAQAEYLKANPDVRVMIEGHADERGTREYNLALGARRANASKAVLVNEGIDASRISTISFGKDRPWVQGTGERVWAQNRNTTTMRK